jgi:restriction system protein
MSNGEHEQSLPAKANDDDEGLLADVSSWWASVSEEWWPRSDVTEVPDDSPEGQEVESDDDPTLFESAREHFAAAVIASIRAVSSERDREEIVRWFADAEMILEDEDDSVTEKASKLYSAINTRRLAGILANTARTTMLSYNGASLPLGLKLALPLTAGGIALLGWQGAGIAAFGSAVGLPVALLMFLGTTGAVTVVEAFVKDHGIRDPLTKLLMTMIAAEAARRIDKEILKAMRADATVPERASMPPEQAAILGHLQNMDPFDFERHVMTFFEDMGYPVGVTAKANDGGFDGYVLHPDGPILVQCKRYASTHPVGRPEVQQLMGVIMQRRAFRAYVVTTSGFTDKALEAAATCDRLELINGTELVQWHVNGKRSC